MGCYDDIEQADAFVLWGATWRKCTRSSGRASLTVVSPTERYRGGAFYLPAS